MIYTVTFNPAIDYVTYLGGALALGAVNRNRSEEYQFGGKGINVSNVLKTLGYDSVALGFVAGFTGDGLEQGLAAMGLKTDFIHVAGGMTRINVKIKASQETEINGIGPDITDDDMEKLYGQLDLLQSGDVLILSGSIPRCLPDNTYERILARLQNREIRFIVDAEGDLLKKAMKYRPFLVKPNHQELAEMFGKTSANEEDLMEWAQRLQAMGGRNILVSMAGDGALLLDELGKFHRIGCPKGKVKNSTGAGDSMIAGFLAGFLSAQDYEYALKLGTAAGSATAFSVGLASREEIRRLLEKL